MIASIICEPVSPPIPPPPDVFSGSVALTSGIATFGQVIPESQVPSGSYVKVGSLTTQNDIKTTWDDGSIRFVVLTCEPGSSGDYALSRDNTSQASAMSPPAIPSNTYVDLDIGGSVYRATCPTTHSSDKWLNGSLCVESRFEVIPILVSDGTTEHGFLRVIFDIRSYSVSEYRVDVTVENCLDKSGADIVTYDVEIFVNNISVYSLAAITHAYCARWRKKFFTGTEGRGHPDRTKMAEAGATPTYSANVVDSVYTVTGTDFDPMKIGGLNPNMIALGGEPIALYPGWAVKHLVHDSTTPRQKNLLQADLAGSYSCHVHNRESTNAGYTGVGTISIPNIDDLPAYWFANASGTGNNRPQGNMADAARTYKPDISHQPSFACIPYLVTGDRYYHDEMIHWASFCLVVTYPLSGGRGATGSEGLLKTEPRGLAWGLRNICDASIYSTDSNIRTYLQEKLSNNITWLAAKYTDDTTPLGTLFTSTFSGIRPQWSYSTWQNHYLMLSIYHINSMGFSGAENTRNQIAQTAINIWNLDTSSWPNEYTGVGYVDVREWDGSTLGDYHTTWAAVFEQTFDESPLTYSGAGQVVGTASDHRVAAMLGIELGLTGAQTYYDYIMSVAYSDGIVTSAGWFIEAL